MPLQVHLKESDRKAVVAAANAVGARLMSEKKKGPWLSTKFKRQLAAKVAAEAETVEGQPSGVEEPVAA
jgi:hypothetical protein